MNIIIRKTTDKEVESFERGEWKSEDISHYGRPIAGEEWKPTFFTFKAEKEGKIVGVIGGFHIAGVLFIERIIVKNSERNQGIGKKLLLQAEKHAIEINSHKIYLYTGKRWKSNDFYKKYGYRKTVDLPKHFFKKDFVIYTKYL